VNIDFQFLYPGKELILFEKWDSFVDKFINVYPSIIKDKYIKEELGSKLATVNLSKGEFFSLL
jgi:hypothetical protein